MSGRDLRRFNHLRLSELEVRSRVGGWCVLKDDPVVIEEDDEVEYVCISASEGMSLASAAI